MAAPLFLLLHLCAGKGGRGLGIASRRKAPRTAPPISGAHSPSYPLQSSGFAVTGLISQGTHGVYPDSKTWAKPVASQSECAAEFPESLLKHTLQGPRPRAAESGPPGWDGDRELAFLARAQVELMLLVPGPHVENVQFVVEAMIPRGPSWKLYLHPSARMYSEHF